MTETEEKTATATAASSPVATSSPVGDAGARRMRWYVLRVASNKEEQVRDTLLREVKIEALEDRIGRILVPTLKER